MATLKAIRNHIVFQFEDQVVRRSNMGKNLSQFAATTDWGFEISSYDEGTKMPRWIKVISVGKDVAEDIKKGSRVLVEPLSWTEAATFEGNPYWRTDETKILLLDEDFQP